MSTLITPTRPGLQLAVPALRQSEPFFWILHEQAGFPTRFEAHFADPAGALWRQCGRIAGAAATATLDNNAVPLRVWGRRLRRRADDDGTVLVVFGFDDSYRLHALPQHRSFGKTSLEAAAKLLAGEADLAVKVAGLAGRVAGADNPLVQYDETALQFLRRHARMVGGDIWPYRGTLYVGHGPGHGAAPVPVHLDEAQRGALPFVIEESWVDEAAGDVFPRTGTGFVGAPTLKSGGTDARARPNSAAQEAIAALGLKEALGWPAGIALGDDSALAQAAALARQRARQRGVMPLPGPPPAGLRPGGAIQIRIGATDLASDLLVTGVTHTIDGAARRTELQFGQPGDFRDRLPDLHPAHHLWAAVTAGAFDPRVATVPVKLLGWHPASKPLPARLLSFAAVPEAAASVRVPAAGELCLVGFEGGNPDAPVVLGTLHDAAAPPADGALWVLRLPGGGELRLTADKGKLAALLKGTEFTLSSDNTILIKADKPLTIKAPEIHLDE